MNIKKLFAVVVAIAMVVVFGLGAWVESHINRPDAVVVATADHIMWEKVTVRLDNGHLYAFDVVDGENIYNVNNEIKVAMWDGLTPDDPTDDQLFNLKAVAEDVKEVLF